MRKVAHCYVAVAYGLAIVCVKVRTLVLLSICASAQCYDAVAFPPGQQANNSCQRAAIVVVVQVDDVWGIFNYLQSSLFTSNS